MLFHPLQKLALLSSNFLVGGADVSMSDLNFMGMLTRPVVSTIRSSVSGLPEVASGLVLIAIGFVMIVAAVYFVGKLMKQLMVGRAKELLNIALGRGMLSGIAAGTLITVIVQSSTTTTSLVVPLAGAGVVTLWQVYPFTLGANIGTTLTAILAATAVSGPMAVPAMQIAFVHFYFSVLGVIVVMGIPFLRNLPVMFAQWLARLATERKIYALIYLVSLFVVVPLVLIFMTVWI
jgi:sodium-dependent phosphate cotransporter